MHLSARQSVLSAMRHRNINCSMGSYSKADEYEWREASAEKIQMAKTALTNALARS
jgi:copper homeostasis protein